jgi:hypothetical protein
MLGGGKKKLKIFSRLSIVKTGAKPGILFRQKGSRLPALAIPILFYQIIQSGFQKMAAKK